MGLTAALFSERVTSMPTIEGADLCRECPHFFGSASEALYAVFSAPESTWRKDRVLVFTHSLGIEHMVTQRMEVLGGRAAAKAGFAAFRYDSRAHGDSTGDAREVTFADLVDDACAAADYARKLSGAARIIWVGVRFGSLIAAAAIARRNDTAALALWEPLHQGGEYFRSAIRAMLFCQVAQSKDSRATLDDQLKRLEAEGMLPVVGTYLYRALYHSAQERDLGQLLQNWGGNTLIAQVQSRRKLSTNNEALRSAIGQRGGNVKVALIGQEPPWGMLPLVRPQWTSELLLTATKEWLDGME
jgi:pimeloyl-ACP methyl ester carboxylesterase